MAAPRISFLCIWLVGGSFEARLLDLLFEVLLTFLPVEIMATKFVCGICDMDCC